MIPYSLRLGRHGLTRNVQNLDRLCIQHQLILLGSQSLTYYLRYSWKQFFGALGLHSASFPLILYHEQVKLQCFSFLLKLSNDVLL